MILIFVSSLNDNLQLAKFLQNELTLMNKQTKLINIVDLELPLFDSRKDRIVPDIIKPLLQEINESKGIIFVNPEYNYSTPPIFTNFLAWASRFREDYLSAFLLKRIQLATHSGSNGSDLCNSMRVQFSRIGSCVMPKEIITHYGKSIEEVDYKNILEEFIN
jgi:NAD(P)H-dependent FMN reductase